MRGWKSSSPPLKPSPKGRGNRHRLCCLHRHGSTGNAQWITLPAQPFGLVKGLGNTLERERVRDEPLKGKAFAVASHKGQGLRNGPGGVVRGGDEPCVAAHERGGIV